MNVMREGALWLGSVGLTTLLLASAIDTRTNAATYAPQSQMTAKDADPDWEVVTVKPADPNSTLPVLASAVS